MVKPILIWLCDKAGAVPSGGEFRLSKHKVACFLVFGTAAVTLAAYSAVAQRSNRAVLAEQASNDFLSPQTPNRAAKTHRLTALQAIEHKAVYALASAAPSDLPDERAADPVIAAAPAIPDLEPTRVAPPAVEQKTAALPATEKPKHVLPPPPAPSAKSGLLDDGQIAGLKGRLRLSSDQAEYWPAVEAALRDVVRTHLRGTKHVAGGKVNIDTNSPEVQKLIWAAMPLLMRLREDQKSEVRKLARVIGLEQVASQI
jgi:hypothetical protein